MTTHVLPHRALMSLSKSVKMFESCLEAIGKGDGIEQTFRKEQRGAQDVSKSLMFLSLGHPIFSCNEDVN